MCLLRTFKILLVYTLNWLTRHWRPARLWRQRNVKTSKTATAFWCLQTDTMKQTAVAVWIINTTETTECTAGLALRNSRAWQAPASGRRLQCLEQNTPFGQAESANFFGRTGWLRQRNHLSSFIFFKTCGTAQKLQDKEWRHLNLSKPQNKSKFCNNVQYQSLISLISPLSPAVSISGGVTVYTSQLLHL